MNITRWSIPKSDWLYSLQPKMEKLYSVSKTRPGAACGSDHELLIAKFRLKLKKVGKTTRPFRYDLNQIPYDYTVEVTNRFKGLDLIHRVPEELWMEVWNIVQEMGIKTIPKKKKHKKAKWLSEEGLQIAEKRREVKGKGEKERYIHLNAEFHKISRLRKIRWETEMNWTKLLSLDIHSIKKKFSKHSIFKNFFKHWACFLLCAMLY